MAGMVSITDFLGNIVPPIYIVLGLLRKFVMSLCRCIDINQKIQSNPFLKSMATPHEIELPCDIIISPPHSFFRCLSESFIRFLQKDKVNLFFSTPRKDRSPFTKVIYAPYIQ